MVHFALAGRPGGEGEAERPVKGGVKVGMGAPRSGSSVLRRRLLIQVGLAFGRVRWR